MVLCDRCQRNIAQFECEICNAVYCPDCDTFIHSNKPKINHNRKKIEIYEPDVNSRDIPKISLNPSLSYSKSLNLDKNNQNNLLNSNTNWNNNNSLYQANIENNKSITIPPPNEIEQEQDNEHQLLSKTYPQHLNNADIMTIEKNKELNKDINNSNEFDKIDKIKNYTTYDRKNYSVQNLDNCISDKNNNINDNIQNNENLINEKDNEIRMLQKSIEEQREIINKLKSENNNLEEIIEKDRQKKDELYKEKKRLYNRKRKIEDFYSEKQKEIQKIYDLEKYRLIEEYENQMRDISDNFINKKSDYIKGIQEIEEKMREYEKINDDEKKKMFDEIDRLKNEGINADKEQEYLIRSNDELNNKLRETTSNIDLLRATALVSTVPKMKSLLKNKNKKKVKGYY